MIAAAAAALTSGAFAVQAQVYEMTLTAKTTTCASAKASNGWLTTIAGYEKGDEILYRKQTSRKLVAVLWGCSCDEVFGADGEWGETDGVERADGSKPYYGSVLFDKKAGELVGEYDSSGVTFTVLNRIGKKANEVEMSWDMVVDEDGLITGAGFGKIKDINLSANGDDCDSVISSAKGTFAGFAPADSLIAIDSSCPYCVEGDELTCSPWVYCECVDLTDEDNTILFGNWSLKYNSSASKKLSSSTYITSSYKFPKNVAAVLVAAGE